MGVFISAFGHVPDQMSLARALITPNPLGRPLGAPFDTERQREVVVAALDLLTSTEPTVRKFPLTFRRAPS